MVFMIGTEEAMALQAAFARARQAPLSLETVRQAAESFPQEKFHTSLEDRKAPPPKRDPEQVLIPNGYRAAITCEHQPAGLCLHLSVSSPNKGRVPRVEAIDMLMQALGLSNWKDRSHVWMEEFEPGHEAINIICLLEPLSAA